MVHFAICFTVSDIYLKPFAKYPQCVCITEIYAQKSIKFDSSLLKRVIECLTIASVATNSYLTFFMSKRLHDNSKLARFMTDITDRSKSNDLRPYNKECLYMVRPTRAYLGLLLDHEYLHEFRAALQLENMSYQDIVDASDKLLLMGYCQVPRHAFTADSPKFKQFAYIHSLLAVFNEDHRGFCDKSKIWKDFIIGTQEIKTPQDVPAHFQHESNKIHDYVNEKLKIKPQSKTPTAFPPSTWNDENTLMSAEVEDYIKNIMCGDDSKNIPSTYPNEDIISFYQVHESKINYNSLYFFGADEKEESFDAEMLSQETDALLNDDKEKINMIEKLLNSQHKTLSPEDFVGCECKPAKEDDIGLIKPID
jgi:hypothetical protein